jgi:hypothetical protein
MSPSKAQADACAGAWERARHDFEADLSTQERHLFTSTDVSHVLAEVKLAEQVHQRGSRARTFSQMIQPLVAAIDHYGQALDTISNSSSAVLCPLWGSLRVLLRVSPTHG